MVSLWGLAKKAAIARGVYAAWQAIDRRRLDARRAQRNSRLVSAVVAAGGAYLAWRYREQITAAARQLFERFGFEGEAGPSALDYAEPPPKSAKKQRKEARREAAQREDREGSQASGGPVHVQTNAKPDLAVPLHEALRGIDTK